MQQGLHPGDRTGQGQQVWREWLLAPVKVLTVAIDEEREIVQHCAVWRVRHWLLQAIFLLATQWWRCCGEG